MSPFVIGLVAGLMAAAVLTFAFHRLRSMPALYTLVGTILSSMLPRIYFSLGAYRGSWADLQYTGAWMLVVSIGFFCGFKYLGRFFKKRSK